QAARVCNKRSNRLLFLAYAHALTSSRASSPRRRGRDFRQCEELVGGPVARSKLPSPTRAVRLELSFQEYCAVFRLFADLRGLIEIANVTASRGGQVFEFRKRITKLWPRIRMKFTDYVRVVRKNLLRTFQNTDFRSLCIDFHATGLRQVAFRKIRIESDERHSNLLASVRIRKLHCGPSQRRLRISTAAEEDRLADFIRACAHFNYRPFNAWIKSDISYEHFARVRIRFNGHDMTGLTTLCRHQETIRAVVCAHIYGGVTFRQMVAEPRDLQSIISGDAVGRARIAQPDWARARQ